LYLAVFWRFQINNDMDKIETTLARVEERVSNIADDVKTLQVKLLNGITDRLSLLERKVDLLENSQTTFGRWIDLGFKVVGTVVAAVILYKLFGIS
jgi:ABC-type uncharacterized transport system fused permease/ATPase subunit